MKYTKYKIDLGDVSFLKTLKILFSSGKVIVVGMRLEEHELEQKEFETRIKYIGNYGFYENFPLFILLVNNIDELLTNWDLLKSFFQSTFIYLLLGSVEEDLDVLYKQYFNTELSDSLIRVAHQIWRKETGKEVDRRVADAPCLILLDSMGDWGLVCVYEEMFDSNTLKQLVYSLGEEVNR